MDRFLYVLAFAGIFTSPSGAIFSKFKSDDGERDVSLHAGCRLVYDDVWEEKCRTIYRNVCETVTESVCTPIKSVECSQKFDSECHLALEKSCRTIRVPYCSFDNQEVCTNIRSCKSTTEKVCSQFPKKICSFHTDVVGNSGHSPLVYNFSDHTISDDETFSIQLTSNSKGDFEASPITIISTSDGSSQEFTGAFLEPLTSDESEDSEENGESSSSSSSGERPASSYSAPPGRSGRTLFKKYEKILSKKSSLKDGLKAKLFGVKGEESEGNITGTIYCKKINEQVCRDVPKTVCADVPECVKAPKKTCGLHPKEKCLSYPTKKCKDVPREVCTDSLDQQSCRDVAKERCAPRPRKSCQKLLVKRPREVCGEPTSSH